MAGVEVQNFGTGVDWSAVDTRMRKRREGNGKTNYCLIVAFAFLVSFRTACGAFGCSRPFRPLLVGRDDGERSQWSACGSVLFRLFLLLPALAIVMFLFGALVFRKGGLVCFVVFRHATSFMGNGGISSGALIFVGFLFLSIVVTRVLGSRGVSGGFTEVPSLL